MPRNMLLFAACAFAAAGRAQDVAPAPEKGTGREELSEVIVVVARKDAPPTPAPYTVMRVGSSEIASLNAAATSQVLRTVPGAHVVTNSRGEALVYMRNAGERQVAVFFDGALLNVPWDNRIDLNLIPGPIVGGLSVVQGIVPVEYGANAMGGALNLTSVSMHEPRQTTVVAQAGSEGRLQGSVAHQNTVGDWRYAGVFGHSRLDGLPVPDGASLPYSQSESDLRTNTDAKTTFAAGHATYATSGGTELRLALLHVDGEKGVAPESHLDPAASRVRFWRYPVTRNTMGIVSAQGTLGADTFWRGAAWVNRFEQTLDAFTSDAYDTLDGEERSSDLTLGARLVAHMDLWAGDVKLALNALTSTHTVRELDYGPDGQPLAGVEFPRLTYRQATLSAGLEYRYVPVERLALTFGSSFDALYPLATGDKPSIAAFKDYAVTATAGYSLSAAWHLRAGLGRKTRFPTMKELFGESLGQFLTNRDLEPESSVLYEVGLGFRGAEIRTEIVPFASFTSDTIDQRRVTVPGESRPRRQRINLKGSRVIGVEWLMALAPRPDVDLQAHVTVSRARRIQDLPTDPVRLPEKPDVVGRIAGTYGPEAGLGAQIEAVYAGRAYSLDVDNTLAPLPRSLALNLRVSYRWPLPGSSSAELFARADNVFDELVLPQLGLPAAGRTMQGGVTVSF